MADNVLDIKDVKEIVEEGLKITKGNWEKARNEDKESFDSKVTNIVKEIEEKGYASKEDIEKAVVEKTKGLEEEVLKLKKGNIGNGKPLGFKAAMAKALKENHEEIRSAEKIKGMKVIPLYDQKDITYSGNFPGFDVWREDLRNEVIMLPRDVFHLRDIIPVGSTSGDTVKYPKEGAKTGDGPEPWARAATIAATDPKEPFEPNMSVVTAEVEWIAGIMRLPVEMLADLPFLTSYLQQFARVELLEAEDDQLLNGTGTSPELDGLIPNATAYAGSYTGFMEMLIDAAYGTLGQANIMPNYALVNPQNVVDIILNKSTGSGQYDLPSLVSYVNGELRISGLGVRTTNKITVNEFLVGDFNSAQILQRMAPQVRFFEQDQDNVVKNLITVRVEERIVQIIKRANAFVTGTYTPST